MALSSLVAKVAPLAIKNAISRRFLFSPLTLKIFPEVVGILVFGDFWIGGGGVQLICRQRMTEHQKNSNSRSLTTSGYFRGESTSDQALFEPT